MTLGQRCGGEFLGTAALLSIVVGSGIMGETLASGNQAVALLANSIATGAGLFVLIQCLSGISGSHFNPAVSWWAYLNRKLSKQELCYYLLAQILGAFTGVLTAHFLFGQNLLQVSNHDRSEWRLVVSELLATAGLLLVIQFSKKRSIAANVALYITAAYWFTSSTSFANPAVTLARSLTDTFAGIAPGGLLGFVAAQLMAVVIIFYFPIFFGGQKRP